ncbi:mechanosensitive ion channel family protein [Pelagicoccus albus]|uniref:Mechanosensitive ion channel n=1 Tax=Pelagicoccus albus TaxID=415222 RepID=A0A7X1E8S1_9BACT|nr:mechanosensitive ion channel domain-containing protein [Pelagicoccus albus]MBC2606591.1 mechanosensitive ion channel [Pelagicoccus albus]
MIPIAAAEFSFSGFYLEVKTALTEMANDFAQFLPKLLLALILLVIGYAIAKVLSKLVRIVFEKLGVNSLLEKSGFTGQLQRAGIKASPGTFIASLVFWVTMLFVIKIAAQSASIQDISDIIIAIISFMPNAITAGLIMLFGFIAADIIKNAVFNALDQMGLEYARTLSKVIFGFIFVLILTVALSKINIQTELLNATVQILLGSLALALALALGLGLKRLAGSIVSGVYSRDIYKVGTVVEFEGEDMTISGIGPVTTKLKRKDGGFVIVPNERLISEPVRGRSAE